MERRTRIENWCRRFIESKLDATKQKFAADALYELDGKTLVHAMAEAWERGEMEQVRLDAIAKNKRVS